MIKNQPSIYANCQCLIVGITQKCTLAWRLTALLVLLSDQPSAKELQKQMLQFTGYKSQCGWNESSV